MALAWAAVLALAAPAAAAEFLGAHTWEPPRDWLGGLSGLEVSPDGARALALSDRAGLVEIEFERREGRIAGIRYRDARRIEVLQPDTEGLAVAADGAMSVTVESFPRLLRWAPGQRFPTSLPLPGAFSALARNRGLEALAVAEDGAHWTLPEAPNWSGDYGLWRIAGDEWRRMARIPGGGRIPILGYRAVGLDFDDRGRLYLLERRVSLRIGFQSRIRRLTLDAENRVAGIETLLVTEPRQHDNLEGISAWRDDAGRLRLTLVSDDNNRSFQRTEFVEYAVPD